MLWYFLICSLPPLTSTKDWSWSTKLIILPVDGLRLAIWRARVESVVPSSAPCAGAQVRGVPLLRCCPWLLIQCSFHPCGFMEHCELATPRSSPCKVLISIKKALWNLESRHLTELGESNSSGCLVCYAGLTSNSDEIRPLNWGTSVFFHVTFTLKFIRISFNKNINTVGNTPLL